MTVERRPPVTTLLLDLDDTLYESSEMSEQVADNIRKYMVTRLGVGQADVEALCRELYLNYGTTLAGLVANGHVIDYDDWHAFVHGTLPYEQYLKPDPKLRALLESIPLPKYIFTNADSIHTERCLSLLGLQGCFAGIICFETVMKAAAGRGATHNNRPVVCKPNRMAMEIALQLAGEADAKSTAFFDDSTRNITMATRMGVYAALVGRTGVDCHADVQLRRIHDLPNLLPWLFAVGDGIPTDHGIVLEPEAEGAEELREEAGNGKSEILVPA